MPLWDIDDRDAAVEWIILNQLGRRNLPAYERAKLALKLEPIIAAKAKENLSIAGQSFGRGMEEKPFQKSEKAIEPINAVKQVAKVANVSHDTIAKVKKIEANATPEQKEKLSSGRSSQRKTGLKRRLNAAKHLWHAMRFCYRWGCAQRLAAMAQINTQRAMVQLLHHCSIQ